jgi:hypothetical protein
MFLMENLLHFIILYIIYYIIIIIYYNIQIVMKPF